MSGPLTTHSVSKKNSRPGPKRSADQFQRMGEVDPPKEYAKGIHAIRLRQAQRVALMAGRERGTLAEATLDCTTLLAMVKKLENEMAKMVHPVKHTGYRV